MDAKSNSKYGNHLQRELAALKVVSRLIGHELHSQSGTKSISFSREEVIEIQTTLDMFIEHVGGRGASAAQTSLVPTAETHLVPARN